MNIRSINNIPQDIKTDKIITFNKKDNDTNLKLVESSYKDDQVSLSKIKASNHPPNNQVFDKIDTANDPMSSVKAYSGKFSIFPSDWQSSKVKAKADVPNSEDLKHGLKEVKNAINKYPEDFLVKQKVKDIHLVGNLSCFGVNYTGTNSRDNVYIGLTNNKNVEKTFHHELSSVLLRNNPANIDKSKWQSLSNSQNSSSASAIKQGLESVDLNPALFDKGFLTDYSMSNPENDFNMYAENLFSGGKEFWDIVDKNPKIADKAKIVIGFYEKLNPVFNEDYFRALSY